MHSESNPISTHSPENAKTLAAKEKFGTATRVIDVHQHFEPTFKNVDGTAWSIQAALDEMDGVGITTAIGYAGPLFAIAGEDGRKHARETNEWSTRLCRDHPGRFGLFASLPLSDVDGSLAEIAYVFDELKADGIGLATHYDGLGLGDPKFEPIFEELQRRKAVVYVHPAGSPCSIVSTVTYESDAVSAPWVEFPTNTARTILSLWAAGTTLRYRDVKFIFCHGGGTMPMLLGRIAGFSGWRTVGPERLAELFPDGVYAEFAKFYFELAQAYAPETVALLRSIVPASHLLYGSDFSYFPIAHSAELFSALQLPDDVRTMIAGANAAAILPRWNA